MCYNEYINIRGMRQALSLIFVGGRLKIIEVGLAKIERCGKITDRRKRVRVVEGARLERVYAGNRIGGSNPLASAILAASCRFFVLAGR